MRIRAKAKKVTLKSVESYLSSRCDELDALSSAGHPWGFLAACTILDFLASLEAGAASTNRIFKKFCSDFLFKTRSEYGSAIYTSRKGNGRPILLVNQLYHVLRCGITHGFSMSPVPHPATHPDANPVARSLLLAHKKSGHVHLQRVEHTNGLDAYVLISELFAKDVRDAACLLFKSARQRDADGTRRKQAILTHFAKYPPLGWTEYVVTKP